MAETNIEHTEIARCAMCADMCKCNCPTYLATGRETLSPQKMARLIVYSKKGFLEDEEGFFGLMFQSAMCGACSSHCIYGNYDLRKFIHQARVSAFDKGLIPEDVSKRVETYIRFGNPDGAREMVDRGTGDAGYFISCSSYKDEHLLSAMEQVVSKSGREVRQFGGGDMCCGAPLYYAGDIEGFRQASLKMKAEVEARQLRRLVLDCPTCLKMMRDTYQEIGVDLDVELVHTTQFLQDVLKQQLQEFVPTGKTVTYHDPCILSYDLAIVDLPREIITALGFGLKEPVYSGQHTHCCGSVYGAKIGDRNLKDAVTSMRVRELWETGADIVVTACPTCKSVLSETSMKYITELVAERILAR